MMYLFVTHLTKHNFLKYLVSLLSKLSSTYDLLISSIHLSFFLVAVWKTLFFFLPFQNLPPNHPRPLSLSSFWSARCISFFLWPFRCKSIKHISMTPDSPLTHRPDYRQQRWFSLKRRPDILFLLHINCTRIINGCFEAKCIDVFTYIPDMGIIFWLMK